MIDGYLPEHQNPRRKAVEEKLAEKVQEAKDKHWEEKFKNVKGHEALDIYAETPIDNLPADDVPQEIPAMTVGDGKQVFVIKATSAPYAEKNGDVAQIMINDDIVWCERNADDHYRGLHLAVINPKTGKVETAKVFDTYKSSAELDKFITEEIPEGHIVAAACQDECHTNLSQSAKLWFEDMGSKEIWNLDYRKGFSFVGISGRKQAQDKVAAAVRDKVSVTQVVQIGSEGESQEQEVSICEDQSFLDTTTKEQEEYIAQQIEILEAMMDAYTIHPVSRMKGEGEETKSEDGPRLLKEGTQLQPVDRLANGEIDPKKLEMLREYGNINSKAWEKPVEETKSDAPAATGGAAEPEDIEELKDLTEEQEQVLDKLAAQIIEKAGSEAPPSGAA